jgi:hypothetical protein
MDAAGPTAEAFIWYRTMSIVKVAATSVNITAESALALLFVLLGGSDVGITAEPFFDVASPRVRGSRCVISHIRDLRAA